MGHHRPEIGQPAGAGRKRTVDLRAVVNAIFYRTRTGCQWRMLPKEFPIGDTSGTTTKNGPKMAPGSGSMRPCAAWFAGYGPTTGTQPGYSG